MSAIWRIKFGLHGRLAYLAHLDLLTVWERALRRGSVPVCYSQGFNPHMQISFGPAHAVGMEADGDYLDIETADGLEPHFWLDFNQYLPQGISILDAREIEQRTAALMKSINIAEYSLRAAGMDLIKTNAAIKAFFAAESVPFERKSPKGNKLMDFRPCIESIVCDNDSINIRIKVTNNGTPRPNEVALLIAPEARILGCCRTALWVETAEGELLLP